MDKRKSVLQVGHRQSFPKRWHEFERCGELKELNSGDQESRASKEQESELIEDLDAAQLMRSDISAGEFPEYVIEMTEETDSKLAKEYRVN